MINFVVNTRSINKNDTRLIFQSNKIKSINLPSIEIKPVEFNENKNPLEKIISKIKNNSVDYLVLSSVNSLNHCPEILKKTLIQSQIPVAAVGPITAKKAKIEGLNLKLVANPVGMTGFFNFKAFLNKTSFLFLKGNDGNQTLIDYLKKEEKKTKVIEVYLRKEVNFFKPPEKKIINQIVGQKCLWLFYSQSALISAYNNFKNNSNHLKWFINQPILCFSEMIRKKAIEFGFVAKIVQIDSMKNKKVQEKINHLILSSKI